jgi:Flp pilus assembly protein TadG
MSSRTLRRRGADDDGAVVIEMVLIVPLIVMLLLAIAEFGFAFRDSNTLSSATRSGARVASNLADERWADFAALESVRAAVAGTDSVQVEMVVIYNAPADGAVPTACLTGSVAGVCNHYDASDFASLTAANFGNQTDTFCGGGAADSAWCPTSRNRGTDLVGVYIESRHDSLTGLLGTNFITLTDEAIMRLEPAQ